MVNRYTIITNDINRDRLRVILTSGQAVVFYGLASHSKDGDWFIREDQEALDFVLEYLESKGAFYRIGAPLALPWLAGGWSSHFEFADGNIRVLQLKVAEPIAWEKAVELRPTLEAAVDGQDELEVALDAERRALMKLDDERIRSYAAAGKEWEASWQELSAEAKKLPLRKAHAMILEAAQRMLPPQVRF